MDNPLVLLRDSNLEDYRRLNPLITSDGMEEVVENNALKDINFINSKDDILIQVVDVMANLMRRILNGKINDKGVIESIGQLHMQEQEIVKGILKFIPILWVTFNEHSKAFSEKLQAEVILLNSKARRYII